MDLQDLAAWGEFLGGISGVVGSVGVIATLVYLATQTRLNTRAVEASRDAIMAQIYQARTDSRRRNLEWMIDSDAVKSIGPPMPDGHTDLSWVRSLAGEELARFRQMMEISMLSMDNHVYQHQQGILDDDFYRSYTVRAIRMQAPIWKELGLDPRNWRKAFAEEVDRIVAEGESLRAA